MHDPLLDPPERLRAEARRRLRLLDTSTGIGRLTTAVGVLFALAFAAFLATGANGPDDPSFASGATERVPPQGFGEVEFVVQRAGAPPRDRPFCGLLAATPDSHRRGMMGRRDLGGYDAMIFRFEGDQTNGFWNQNVPIALSIAWFDARGRFVSTADMPPCDGRDDCPTYTASAPYRFAVEVPQGGLAGIDIGPGAVLVLGSACREGAPAR